MSPEPSEATQGDRAGPVMNAGPLAGRRVLELGSMLAAPFGAHILAELGAEVIKIEPPSGDSTRSLVRGGPSGTLIAYSQGKQSLALDLAQPGGMEAFRSLLKTADILIHNLAPRSARKLGLTYEDCAAVQPAIVYCHIRGYAEGPLADELASNPVAEASTGVMEGHRIDGRPSRLGPSYHDQFAGAYGVIGILSALLAPRPSAATHCIEVGLYEVGLHVAARDLAGVQLKSQLLGRPEREPNGEFSMPGYGAYQTADERWIYLLILNDGHWQKFCQALKVTDGLDAGLARLRDRKKQRERVERLVNAAVASLRLDQVQSLLKAAGVGCTEVLPIERVLDSPQARHPGKLRALRFRGLNFEVPRFPIRLGQTGAATGPHGLAELGADSAALLLDAGLPADRYAELIQQGAVHADDEAAFAWAPVRTGA